MERLSVNRPRPRMPCSTADTSSPCSTNSGRVVLLRGSASRRVCSRRPIDVLGAFLRGYFVGDGGFSRGRRRILHAQPPTSDGPRLRPFPFRNHFLARSPVVNGRTYFRLFVRGVPNLSRLLGALDGDVPKIAKIAPYVAAQHDLHGDRCGPSHPGGYRTDLPVPLPVLGPAERAGSKSTTTSETGSEWALRRSGRSWVPPRDRALTCLCRPGGIEASPPVGLSLL